MAEKLKQIPGFSQGVRANAAARMVKLVRPICPNSKVDMVRTPEGKWVPNPEPDPTKQNCQRMGGRWWEYCVEQGHNPYFTERVWYEKVDIYDETTNELTGSKTVRHKDVYPNIAQVAAHIRVNSGRGPQGKMRLAGFKRLKELGYEEVCQFRNCQKPVEVTSRVGLYCGQEHAMLIAADSMGEFLNQPNDVLNTGSEVHVRQKRAKTLQEAAVFADIKSAS